MTKIGLHHILIAHLATLKDEGKSRISFIDMLTFFITPAIIAGVAAALVCEFSREIFVIAISVFAIFSALLINAQVAIFGISQKDVPLLSDKQKEKILLEEFKLRNKLLAQLNTNISYLIIISCLALVVFIIFYSFELPMKIELLIAVFIFSHFLVTLMMVIKRSHALFQREYDRDD